MSKSTRPLKRSGYTKIPNGLLPEGKISARAWGIYAYLLSRPPGWVIHVRQLQQVFSEGRDAIYTAMKQLAEVGLLEMQSYKEPGQPPKKRYVLPDTDSQDTDSQDKASPDPESPDTALPDTGNQDLKSRALTTTDKPKPESNQLPSSLRSGEDKHLNQNPRLGSYPLSSVDKLFSEEDFNDEVLHASRQQEGARKPSPPPQDTQELLDELWPDRKARKAS